MVLPHTKPGDLTALSRPLDGFQGSTSKGKEGEGRGYREVKGKGGEGRKRNGKGR